jgi:hypothetical protein
MNSKSYMVPLENDVKNRHFSVSGSVKMTKSFAVTRGTLTPDIHRASHYPARLRLRLRTPGNGGPRSPQNHHSPEIMTRYLATVYFGILRIRQASLHSIPAASLAAPPPRSARSSVIFSSVLFDAPPCLFWPIPEPFLLRSAVTR